uniref:CUB domain-containing protein n=1 Tax=Equus asinus TaxID=9793 RepID=A0A8C4M639_EQUAS
MGHVGHPAKTDLLDLAPEWGHCTLTEWNWRRSRNGCGGLLTDLSGRISNYIGPKTVCVWTIQMTPGLHVVMAIPGLNLTCHKEYVEIQDGPPGSASYGKICEGLGLTFRSSSNILTVKYTRKPDHPASSFDVYYYGEPEGSRGQGNC